jgi:hypothetical protein
MSNSAATGQGAGNERLEESDDCECGPKIFPFVQSFGWLSTNSRLPVRSGKSQTAIRSTRAKGAAVILLGTTSGCSQLQGRPSRLNSAQR